VLPRGKWGSKEEVEDHELVQEEDRVVILRFGHDHDPVCMQMDEILAGCADKIKNFAVIYCVDISEVRFLLHSRQPAGECMCWRVCAHA
jgi:hypothetical protein